MAQWSRQFIGYFFTAGTAAVIDIGGFVLLREQGLPIIAAATASFLVAMLVNYGLSSRFVFGAKASGRGLLLFAAGAMVGLVINVGVTTAAATLLDLPSAGAKTVGVGVAFLFNFVINKTVVFGAAGGRKA